MDFTESIKNMFNIGKKENLVPSMPMSMAKPIDGTKVRFWTKQVMLNPKAKTTIENSLVGEYKEGYFMIDGDSWSKNDIFSWTKYKDE